MTLDEALTVLGQEERKAAALSRLAEAARVAAAAQAGVRDAQETVSGLLAARDDLEAKIIAARGRLSKLHKREKVASQNAKAAEDRLTEAQAVELERIAAASAEADRQIEACGRETQERMAAMAEQEQALEARVVALQAQLSEAVAKITAQFGGAPS